MIKRPWVGAVCLIVTARLAHAQPAPPAPDSGLPPPPSATPTGPPATAPAIQPEPIAPVATSTVDKGVMDDANASRGWMTPTALNEPGGTWSISDYELFLLQIGYAVNDQFSISATTIPPLTEDFPLWLLASAKLQVLKSGRVRAAIQGAVTYYSIKDTINDGTGTMSSTDSFTAADLGGALTICIDDGCHSHISGFLGAGFAHDTNSSVPFVGAVTLVGRIAKHVKFVGEVDSAFVAGKVNDVATGALAWYGVRFTSSMIGVDLGFVRPIGVGETGLVLGFPILTFSYRNVD